MHTYGYAVAVTTSREPASQRGRTLADVVDFRIAFWNRSKSNKHAVAQSQWLRRLEPADVLVLAEVTPKALAVFRNELGGVWFAATEHVGSLGHGIAVRVSIGCDATLISANQHACPGARPCVPERGLAVDVAKLGCSIRVLGWHAPYAAGDRRHSQAENAAFKQLGYQHLVDWLAASPRPLLLALDGNNWDDSVEPQVYRAQGDAWDDERLFHSADARHELVDTLRAAEDRPSAMPVTRRNPSGDYRMDRIYVSQDVRVHRAGVTYGDGSDNPRSSELTPPSVASRLAPGSDHALVWAEFTVRTELGQA